MSERDVIESLERLRAEIERLDEASPRTREHLEGLVLDIERRLSDDVGDDEPSVLEALRDGIERFEVEHPRAAGILNDILVKLGAMGI